MQTNLPSTVLFSKYQKTTSAFEVRVYNNLYGSYWSPASYRARWLSCALYWKTVPLVSPFTETPHPHHEAAKEAELDLQSIFSGSDGLKVTPKLVKNAMQESKHGNPRVVCTYCTGRSGLNLWTEETKTWVSMQVPKSLQLTSFGI